MRRQLTALLLAVLALGLAGCEDDPEIDTRKDTLGDPLGDIAALGEHFYAANEDRSGHAGSQVDLFRFDPDGFAEDRFDLGLNGVGYLAATADSHFVYLQARHTGQLFKISPVGEIAWTRADPLAAGDLAARGVSWAAAADSFEILYQEPGTTNFAVVRAGPGFDGPAGSRRDVVLDAFDPTHGVLAAARLADQLWLLGYGAEDEMILQGLLDDGTLTRVIALPGATACGLAPAAGGVWIAHVDRRFEFLNLEE